LRELSLAYGGRVVLLDDAEALVDEARFAVDEDDRHARVGEHHRDASPHRAGAEHGDPTNRERRRLGGDVGHLGGLALGEENMTQRRGLGRRDRLFEKLTFALQAGVEGELYRRLDGLDAPRPGSPAARLCRRVLRGLLEEPRFDLALVDMRREVSNARQRALGRDALGKGNRSRQKVALHDLVDETEGLGFGGADGVAVYDHFQRLRNADEAR
jgi:hypothetical protein